MSTADWTVLEKLLLSQAVYKYGEDNWSQIARNLKHHALLDRPSDYFNQKNCSLQYYLMIEDMDKEKRQQTFMMQDMPAVVRLARQLYTLRLEEIQKAISKDEETFLTLVSEIEDIRAGKLDIQLLGNNVEPTESNRNSPKESNENNSDKPPQEDASLSEETVEPSDTLPSETLSENNAKEQSSPSKEDLTPESVKKEQEQLEEIEQEQLEEIEQEQSEGIEEEQSGENKEESGKISPSPSSEGNQLEEQEGEPDDETRETDVIADSPNIDEPPEPTKEQPATRSSHKRLAEEEESLLTEPQLKRFRTEDPTLQEETTESESMIVDTIKTDYSTDADTSQATTPADPKDGDESVGGSESNAPTPTSDRYAKKTNKEDSRQKSWLKNINLLWREIANHKNGAMFMNPIKENIAPQYYDIVRSPMDLKTIKNRIRDGLINTTTEFERDVILMLTNSLMYNTEGTEVYQMAKEMLDDSAEKIRIFKTADEDTSASTHTRASSMAAKDRRKSFATEL